MDFYKNTLKKPVSIILVVALSLPSTVVFAKDFFSGITFAQEEKKNWYYEGRYAAERFYDGTGAYSAGLASGFCLGIIGWGIGYLIMSGMDVDVPDRYIADLNLENYYQFKDGYSEYVKKKRKGSFNKGAGIGTFVGIIVYLVASDVIAHE